MGRSHIIVALDFACINQARAFVSLLSPDTCCLKVGKQMFTLYGPSFVNECVDLGFDVFLDLKFHDIPNTVSAAVLAAAQLGVWMQTLHIQGGVDMLTAACSARDSFVGRKPLLVGVTMLTSLSDEDVSVLGYSSSVEAMVLRYAQLAFDVGLDGIPSTSRDKPSEFRWLLLSEKCPGVRNNFARREKFVKNQAVAVPVVLIVVPGVVVALQHVDWYGPAHRSEGCAGFAE